MKRSEFLKYASSVAVLLANGNVLRATELDPLNWDKREVALRFVIASDGHYGQPGTDFEKFHETLTDRINEEHALNPFRFCMINGDVVHNDKAHYPAAKAALDKLKLKYYVSQGNHDHVTADEWQNIWSMPVNLSFKIGENSFLIGTTADDKGTYLCPDVNWFTTELKQHEQQKNVFIFIHINPGKQTANAVDCPALFELFAKHKNIKAVFNGHDHDEEGIKMKQEIPFIFDAHFGGNWGTEYRGFRIVEVMKDNSLVTWVMNPIEKINAAVL